MAKIKINSNKENVHIGLVEELGQVQFEIFPKVKNAVELFKSQDVKDIIDLGCGLGWNTIFLAREGFNIWAGDICKGYIDTLRDKTSKMNLKNINCKEFDMKAIPYEDNSFDVVICTSTLNHGTLREIKMTIDEIHRVLKPNGILITDLLSVVDQSYGIGKMIEANTFVGGRKGEEGIPHHYTDEKEIIELFKSFKEVHVCRRNYIFDLDNSEVTSRVYDIECVK